jgi:hypothetical protein
MKISSCVNNHLAGLFSLRAGVMRKLVPALLLTFALDGSLGCVSRIPLLLRDYNYDFTPDDELLGCPNLTGTHLVTGQATDYLITFPLPLIVPVWWGEFPEQPRLDVDLGLVLEGDVPVQVPGVTRIEISHPDEHRVLFTLMDDSGSVIEGFEEVEFKRTGREFNRPPDSQPTFYCLIQHPPPSILIGVGLMIPRGYRYPESRTYLMSVMLGRLPDGSLAVRTHAYMPPGIFDVDQQWHRDESASTPSFASRS